MVVWRSTLFVDIGKRLKKLCCTWSVFVPVNFCNTLLVSTKSRVCRLSLKPIYNIPSGTPPALLLQHHGGFVCLCTPLLLGRLVPSSLGGWEALELPGSSPRRQVTGPALEIAGEATPVRLPSTVSVSGAKSDGCPSPVWHGCPAIPGHPFDRAELSSLVYAHGSLFET